MGKDQCQVPARILDLTLEIIYLLTGEEHNAVGKKSGKLLTPNSFLHKTSPITGNPPHCEVKCAKKIVEVAKKITDLLTGEVPIRCQDVTVYFSMEEWEYLEGHKDLYKDIMMENEPDGSRKRNPPQRCPRPRDSTHKVLPIPYHDEQKDLEGNKDLYQDVKMEDQLDGSRKRNPVQRFPRPQDSTKEDTTIPHHDQAEDVKHIKIEIKEEEEEILVSGAQQSMEEEIMMKSKLEESSLHIDTNGRYMWNLNPSGGHLLPSPDFTKDNRSVQFSSRTSSSSRDLHHRQYYLGISMDPSNPNHSNHMTSDILPKPQKTARRSTEPSNPKASSSSHEGVEKGDHPILCLACGKSFSKHRAFLRHQRAHAAHRFSCSECGKCFVDKAKLLRHHRMHTGERPFSCAECGKSFAQKENLVIHQRIHTGERPFSCPECGKCFIEKRILLRHQKLHTGDRPFSCSECGKNYTEKGRLLRHQRVHTGEPSVNSSE